MAWRCCLIAALVVAGCGGSGDDTGSPPRESSSTPIERDGVSVEAFGFVREDPRSGLELCRDDGPCAGIALGGDQLVAGHDRVRIAGSFDGVVLDVAEIGAAPPDTAYGQPEFPVPCAEPPGGWPALGDDQRSPIVEHVNTNPERFGGVWLGDHRVFVVAVPAGNAEVEAELRALDADAPLCVVDVARSQASVDEARAAARQLLQDAGASIRSSSGDVVNNRSTFDVWHVDQRTLDAIARAWGDAVHVYAHLVVVDAALAELPTAPVPDDPNVVALVTERFPAGAGMSALGGGTLAYDPDLDCYYLDNGAERVLPLWPYGTTATRDPAEVYDFDGAVVVRAGEEIQTGGGYGDIASVEPGQRCGATELWVMAGYDAA